LDLSSADLCRYFISHICWEMGATDDIKTPIELNGAISVKYSPKYYIRKI
jgi:hypothetical protein